MPRWIALTFVCVVLAVCPRGACADEVPHARAYLNLLNARLAGMAETMPAVSEAAEVAAEALADGSGFGVRGDDGLATELSNRAGAMMGYDGRRGEPGDVILYVFGLTRADGLEMEELLREQLVKAEELKAGGSVVIGLGSYAHVRACGLEDVVNGVCDAWLDNGVAVSGDRLGAEADGADAVVTAPMQTVLNAAAAWTFQCELFAALTRLDQVPVVRQSFELDTRRRRWECYGSQRFHHDRWLDAIPAGLLGRAYLEGLAGVFEDIGTTTWHRVLRAADKIHQTREADGIVWLRAGGRYLPYHVGGRLSSDPGLFTLLTHDGSNPDLPAPGNNDYVVAVGRYEAAGSHEWGEPELLRKGGRGVAWVVNGYNTQPADLKRREVLVDLWGPVGDCVVKVEEYDTKLGPVSGVTAEAVTWMLAAEAVGRADGNGEDISSDSIDDTESE